jgi:hypothetical protein
MGYGYECQLKIGIQFNQKAVQKIHAKTQKYGSIINISQ